MVSNCTSSLGFTGFILLPLLCWGQDEAALFTAGEQALRQGNLKEARSRFESLLKANPKHLPALANLGVIHSQSREYARAADTYRQALRLAPRHPLLHLNLGLALFKQEVYREAAAEFRQTLASQPGHGQARELLAACQVHTGELRSAVETLESLLRARPAEPSLLYLAGLAYWKLQQPVAARALFDRLMKTVPEPQARFLLGKAHYENGEFEEAAAELERARTLDPAIAGGDRELGKVYISLRRSEDAEARLRAAVAADRQDDEALYYLAGALILQDKNQEALPLLDETERRRPGFWGVHYYRGRLLLQDGGVMPALQSLERAAALNPDEPSTYYQLARAYRQVGRTADAEKSLRKMDSLRRSAR